MTDWPGLHTWHVVFEPTTSAWWGRFLAPGFGHCWAMAYDTEARVWVRVEPLFSGTLVQVASRAVVVGTFVKANEGALKVLVVPHVGVEVRRPRLLMTCAGAVASLLGLRRFPLTPYGLFWTLRRIPGVREIGCGGSEGIGTGGTGEVRSGDCSGAAGGAGEGVGGRSAAA